MTACASVWTPRSMRSRASDANLTSFAAIAATPFYVLPECSREEGGRSGRLIERHDIVDHAKDIALLHDEQILAIDLDLGARPFAEQDPITGLHRQFDERAVVVEGARPDGVNLALLRFFLGGVRDDDAARGLLLGVDATAAHMVVQGAEKHGKNSRYKKYSEKHAIKAHDRFR